MMHLRLKALIIISAITWSACSSTSTTSTSNSASDAALASHLNSAVLWYQTAAEMRQSYYQAYNYGKMLLDKKLGSIRNSRIPAVVLDIDETVLDNSPYEAMLIKKGQVYRSETWRQWVERAQAEALPGALDFTSYAAGKGVEVFYISNRSVNTLEATIKNMKALGFVNTDKAHILLKEDTSDKTARRNKVLEKHDILVFVGDNLTDYSEVFANRDTDRGKALVDRHMKELLEDFVVLPNPMYGEWEKAIYNNDYSISGAEKLKLRQQELRDY